ncbi:hypothetical protein CSUI_007236 [Cystoisospora suis]|uniref:Uncharacterized protein n=1 Tax=Cystoisospora suis TaxID=483139 RepID=A0A2C6KR50_9APIC|nr:hypothetical protein CSUI_007236 [Cystoisospora suis]
MGSFTGEGQRERLSQRLLATVGGKRGQNLIVVARAPRSPVVVEDAVPSRSRCYALVSVFFSLLLKL